MTIKENDLMFLLFFVNIEEEPMGPNVKVLGDTVKFARQPERYARKWRKLAQVSLWKY